MSILSTGDRGSDGSRGVHQAKQRVPFSRGTSTECDAQLDGIVNMQTLNTWPNRERRGVHENKGSSRWRLDTEQQAGRCPISGEQYGPVTISHLLLLGQPRATSRRRTRGRQPTYRRVYTVHGSLCEYLGQKHHMSPKKRTSSVCSLRSQRGLPGGDAPLSRVLCTRWTVCE